MSDFPTQEFHHPPTIHPWSTEAIGASIIAIGGTALTGAASAVYPAANRAILIPFTVCTDILVTVMFVYNGATVSGNLCVGIYAVTEDATGQNLIRLVTSGTVAQSGTSTLQLFDVTDTLLLPGQYYLAIAVDNTTATLFRGTVAAGYIADAIGIRNSDIGALPLPATITSFVTAGCSPYIPVFGLLQGRTVI